MLKQTVFRGVVIMHGGEDVTSHSQRQDVMGLFPDAWLLYAFDKQDQFPRYCVRLKNALIAM